MKLLDKIKERKEKKKHFWQKVTNTVNSAKTFLKQEYENIKVMPKYQKIFTIILIASTLVFCSGILMGINIIAYIGVFGVASIFIILIGIIIKLAIQLQRKKKEVSK